MANQSFDDRDGMIWLDGKLVPWREANVHMLTHAMHYASAVFEGQRAYNGVIYALSEHSERLIRSAEILGFTIPYTRDQIDQAIADGNGLLASGRTGQGGAGVCDVMVFRTRPVDLVRLGEYPSELNGPGMLQALHHHLHIEE